VPAALLLAILSYYLVERPALRLKTRVERQRTGGRVAAQPAASIL
jgi:peptidoglycan/LPS O-acetylase OafA/YrhL